MVRVGVEVGGTFTDLVAIDEQGITVTKVPSVPSRPDEGAFNAILQSGIAIDKIEELAHGSTVATNAVLERKGFATAFITTHGFRDILFLQRHGRSSIYDLEYQKPAPVVERAGCFEVNERILANGHIEIPLDEAQLDHDLLPQLREGKFEAVAVCLLNGYVNPCHEEQLARWIAARLPNLQVACSSAITREFREFERASTTTLSAYVQPVVDRYIERFVKRLGAEGFSGRFSVMQSNGGRLPAEAMRANAVNALLSGPAAGVMGAIRQAERAGFKNLITLDMGGTSTDVCLVTEGQAQLTQEYELDGLPIRVPLIDINTIGAGGGSIVWVDDGGMLRVGPESAGADPGPACYGRGGERATLTDAQIICSRVRPEAFLGGKMAIDAEQSRRVFAPLAEAFQMSLEDIASSAIRLANANVVRAIQLISTQRGIDPRDYLLVPFGGAGPLHAAAVAEDLGMTQVMVPPSAGVISAFGLIASDFLQFSSLTKRAPVDAQAGALVRSIFTEMRETARARFAAMGLSGTARYHLIAEMRFVGQAFEVPVRFAEEELSELNGEAVAARFAEAHHKVYFFGGATNKLIEFVSFRLGATQALEELPILREDQAASFPGDHCPLFDNGGWQEGQLVSRAALSSDQPVSGPALLEDPTSTLFLPSGWRAWRDARDNTIMQRKERGDA